MEDRRTFLKVMGATLASPAVFGANSRVFGANGRVQMGVIGLGTRGNQVHGAFMHNKDVVFVAACDVQQNRLSEFVKKNGSQSPMAAVGDYRRVLDNKDVEAVLITTPDHWHSPMLIDALSAGKDVYVEKPVSNAIEPALKMVAAVRASKQVVQVGCQQRDWAHFQEWNKKTLDGYIGKINHCVLLYPGGGSFTTRAAAASAAGPAGHSRLGDVPGSGAAPPVRPQPTALAFVLGLRRRRDYRLGRPSHRCDALVHERGREGSAAHQRLGDLHVRPGSQRGRTGHVLHHLELWRRFVATLTNATPPSLEDGFAMPDMYGNWFYGQKGVLLVNRFGHELRPNNQRRGGVQQEPLKAERDMDPRLISEDPEGKGGSATVRHTRNFLDCVKSRAKTSCPIEVGFNSTLPTLLAILSVRQKKMFTWDGKHGPPGMRRLR